MNAKFMLKLMGALYLTFLVGNIQAALLPSVSAILLLPESDAVILAEQQEGDKVTVINWLWSTGTRETLPKLITINGLSRLSKQLNSSRFLRDTSKPSTVLDTRRFVAFLTYKEGAWTILDTYPTEGPPETYGSVGMVWISEGQCYDYEQVINPGPPYLMKSHYYKTEEELLTDIAKAAKLAEPKSQREDVDTHP